MGDHVAEVAWQETGPDGVWGMIRRPVSDLSEEEYAEAVANSIESGCEVLLEGHFERYKNLAREFDELIKHLGAQYSPDKRAKIQHVTNNKREVALGYLRDRYECSNEEYVDKCEDLYRAQPEEIIKKVDADYRNSLVARRARGTETRSEQAEKLETIFRAKVVGGKVRTVKPELGLAWGESHLSDLKEMDFDELLSIYGE